MYFEVVGEIGDVEVIAKGPSVRERARLAAQFGGERWRKLKGTALVRLLDGTVCRVEVHWYEVHGIGRKKFKINRILE